MMKRLVSSVRLLHLPAFGAVVLFAWLVMRFWDPAFGFTAFIQLDEAHAGRAIAAFHEYPVFAHPGLQPYDGMQYSQIAYHPLLAAGEIRTAVDTPSYRARRILTPAASWLLAGGRPALIAQVYASLNIVCWLLLAYLFWKRLPVTDARGALAWLGLLFSAGVLGSVRFALIDLPALLLTALALWAIERRRWRSFAGWLAAAALTRETTLLASVACCDPSRRSRRELGRCLLCGLAIAAPLLAWLAFVHWRLGAAGGTGTRNFTWPFLGLFEKWSATLRAVWNSRENPYAWRTLLATVGVTAQAAFIIVRRRPGDPWWRVGASFTLLLLCLGSAAWEGDPGASMRVLLPLNLVCNVLAVRSRAPLRWLLLCNLTVFSGVSLLDRPPAYPEASVRRGLAAATANASGGCYPRESDAHHRWRWCRSPGVIAVHAWPRSATVDVRLTVTLQGASRQNLRVTTGDQVLWNGDIAQEPTSVELPLRITGGEALVSFQSSGRLTVERTQLGARLLGFAIFDPELRVVGMAPGAR